MTRDVYKLGNVFSESVLPHVTYVAPAQARQLKGSLATPGKHVTLVGPSGSGKSTVAKWALESAGLDPERIHSFNARTHAKARSIFAALGAELGVGRTVKAVELRLRDFDLIVIDDVHHLSLEARTELAARLKVWHERGIRFFMIGIARTSEAILGHDPELAIRNDTWYLGTQNDDFMGELMTKGERALNIRFDDASRDAAIKAARGSPSIFQAICRFSCVEADVMQTATEELQVSVDLPVIRQLVAQQYDGRYIQKIVSLARGRRGARAVHDTYYEIIEYVASSKKDRVSRDELYDAVVGRADTHMKARIRSSFYRAIKSLPAVIEENALHESLTFEYDTLTVDDPAFRFYLDHLDFSRVRSQVVIRRVGYEYDVAVSFAGGDRPIVERLVEVLQSRGLNVFYDLDEQALLWGKDLRKELARVYGQQAQYMIVCLSDDYPERDWTTFELEIGRNSASKRTEDYLLPLIIGSNRPPITGLPASVGHVSLNDRSMEEIAEFLLVKIATLPPISPSALRLRPAP